MKPSEGQTFLDNDDVKSLSDNYAAARRLRKLAFVFQQPMLIEGLNILENILLAFAVQGVARLQTYAINSMIL